MTSGGVASLKYLVKRGGETCHYCEELATTVDHIVPDSLGGPSSVWNLQPSCEPCNNKKSSNWPTCSCDKCQSAILTFSQNPVWTDKAQEALNGKIRRMEEQAEEIKKARLRVLANAERARQTLQMVDNLVLTQRYPFDRVEL